MKMVFKEEQKFTQWWVWVILITVALLPFYGMFKQLIQGEPFGDNPLSDVGLILFAIIMAIILALFWSIKLKTTIDEKEISMRFVPFIRKTIPWKDIKSAVIVNYGFVGGWGIRLGTTYGTVYNIKGNKGLAIELKSGKKFLIGTQKEADLTKIVTKYLQ